MILDERTIAKVLLTLFLVLGTNSAPPSVAAESGERLKSNLSVSGDRIDEIDRSLILEFIKLARFNINFHQEANRHQKWRAFSYPMGREAGTAVAFASSVVDLKLRIDNWDRSRRGLKNKARNAVNTALVATAVSGGVSSLELAQNAWMMMRARRLGYAPSNSVAFIKNVVRETDALFAERQTLVGATTDDDTQRALRIDGLLLRRIRQQLLFEFATWSAHSRDLAWRENTFYLLDAGQNFAKTAATTIGLRAFGHPNMGGASVTTTLVANGVATIDPIISAAAGYSMRMYQRRRLAKEFQLDRPGEVPSELRARLDATVADLQGSQTSGRQLKLLQQAVRLADGSERLDQALDRETGEIERFRRVAQQQTIAGPVIGLSGVAGSILGDIAFYDYRRQRRASNHLLLGARLSILSGQSLALIVTPATMISGMRKKRRLEQRGEAPEQLLAQRLKNIAALEAQIKAAGETAAPAQ